MFKHEEPRKKIPLKSDTNVFRGIRLRLCERIRQNTISSFFFIFHFFYQLSTSRYDTNKDGYLCRNELKRMMIKRRVPWTENSLDQLMNDADKDKDGKLTFREVSF